MIRRSHSRNMDNIDILIFLSLYLFPGLDAGYLVETVKDTYRTVSVSQEGQKFLRSCRPDHQPPLLLPMTSESGPYEDNRSTAGASMAVSGHDGLSQAEVQLYKLLLEERMKLARSAGTAPYAICGDLTLEKIVATRPSTKARLANIDGVNQHLVTSAWKMWQEDGRTVEQIANFPGRSAPIKVGTVLGYVLDAAREGCTIDWARLFNEIGITNEIAANIQATIIVKLSGYMIKRSKYTCD
ncbi:hypothetical protein L2E82_27882 [Cichorium intybus]|uniref:Uncharacterized protein n=1 Tax=Cichorium intybus TaxID=13427 RepID=A0ACB9CUN8_CICIN|nr:hypothetical protein L2E82_27882 [Cichorium intybus]